MSEYGKRLKVAIVGTGISGLSAAWLLSQHHDVTVFERGSRIGGHANTVDVRDGAAHIPVDTGFIVYNESAYPNLTALFDHLAISTQPSDMSFAVSLDDGGLEYSGTNLAGLLAQKRNVFRPRFWSMLTDIRRFYREAPNDIAALSGLHTTLGDYLTMNRYGDAFRDDHLLPLAGAIWSASPAAMLDYPAASFIRFQDNHGLLRIGNRPEWRTVTGGSRRYVEKLTQPFSDRIRTGIGVAQVRRTDGGVIVSDAVGHAENFDHVVIATHADEALGLLPDASDAERKLLGAFRSSNNLAVLHSDPVLMPKRRAAWSSWNYIGARNAAPNGECTVTYWLNRLQDIASPRHLFLTLNPQRAPAPEHFIQSESYQHPIFDSAAMQAQRSLWTLQGQRHTWFCGAYFGSGFHEDGLQSGLAVAEALGRWKRPWLVPNESGRIFITEMQSTHEASSRAA